jgi:hypothetical protein
MENLISAEILDHTTVVEHFYFEMGLILSKMLS